MIEPRRNLRLRLLSLLILTGAIAAGIVMLYPHDDSLKRLRKGGSIRIGYAVEAPYAMLRPDGSVTGESPEIAKVVAARLGIGRIVWRQVEFGSLIDELEAGRIDVIAAGMFITPQRARRVSFSLPTFTVMEGLLVLKGNPRQLHSYRQAASRPEIRIAALSGSVEQGILQRLGFVPPRLVLVPDALTGRVAVETGVADGLALSSPTVRWMALGEKLGTTEMAQPFESEHNGNSEGAFAFRKDERRLLAAWNAVLRDFIGSRQHLALIARFGFTGADLPQHRGTGKEEGP
jgi:polar amino acid transport system substrate-binding protein